MKHNPVAHSWNTAKKVVFFALCAILFLPITIIPPSFQPANWGRVSLMKAILIGLAAYLYYRFFVKKDISLPAYSKRNPAFLPFAILIGFFSLIVLATIFSVDVHFSIFGSPSRSGGLIALLGYLVFTIVAATFMDEQIREKLLKFCLVPGGIASTIALIQYFGLLKGIFVAYGAGGAGAPSFIGNSTLLAIYMLFLSFTALWLLLQANTNQQRYIYGGLLATFLLTILITGSRATYLGVLASALFFLVLYPQKFKKLRLAAAGILGIAVIAATLFNVFPQITQTNNVLNTIGSRVSFATIAQDLAGNRGQAWRMTAQAIADRPLLGWGPENFYVGFEKHYQPVNESLQKEWWDRPHNIILDIAVHYGIPALIIYMAFWIALFWRLSQYKRGEHSTKEITLAHTIQAAFIGYGIVLLFNFEEFPTFIMSALFLALALSLLASQEDTGMVTSNKNSFFGKQPVAIILGLLGVVCIWSWGLSPLWTDQLLMRAQQRVSVRKCDAALAPIQNLWKSAGVLKGYASLPFADMLKQCAAIYPENEQRYSQQGAEALKTTVEIQPLNSRAWIALGGFTDILAARTDDLNQRAALLKEAQGYLAKAQELSPQRVETLTELEINSMVSQDYASMETTAQECQAINPRLGVCNWYLGLAKIFQGKITEGQREISLSAEKGFTPSSLLPLAIAYLNQAQYANALAVYDEMNNQNGQVPAWHAVAAALAQEIGDYDKAATEALEVFRLQPDNPEAIQFLELLFQSNGANPSVKNALAQVYREIGINTGNKQLLSNAVALYQQLISQYPQNASYHFAAAPAYQYLGDHLKAQQEAMTAYRLEPSFKEQVIEFLQQLSITPDLRVYPQ